MTESPPPDRRDVEGLFHELAPRYNRVLLAYSLGQDLRWKEVLIRRLRPKRGERALDLACGTGLILDRLSRRLGPSQVVGLDLNRSMLLASGRPRDRYRLVQGNAVRLPFASESFDIVTSGYLLKYVPLKAFFDEMARVLRPGGRLAAYDFSRPIHASVAGASYSFYLHRILPAIGRARSPHRWRAVFEFLPQVAESSGWELRVKEFLTRAGFAGIEVVPSLGGAVTWVWARRDRILPSSE